MKKYRTEWKYRLSNQDLSLLKNRLSQVLKLDPHTPKDGRYIIHSLYLDDYKDRGIYDVDAGISKRYKWRIRYYGDDLSYIVLEKKEKLESRCHKKSTKLTIEEYNYIVNGNITSIMYDTKKDLIKELAKDILLYGYKPKVIIDYERIAYIDEITNIRITIDMKISASYELDHFLDRDYTRYYIQESNYNLLEVKFDNILPSYLKHIIDSYKLNQISFSKYYYGRKIINNYIY